MKFPSGQMKNWLSTTNIDLVWVLLCNFWLCSALESSRVLLLVGKTAQSSDLSRTVRSTLRLTWSNRLQTNPNLECHLLAKMTSRKWERKKVCIPHLFFTPWISFSTNQTCPLISPQRGSLSSGRGSTCWMKTMRRMTRRIWPSRWHTWRPLGKSYWMASSTRWSPFPPHLSTIM